MAALKIESFSKNIFIVWKWESDIFLLKINEVFTTNIRKTNASMIHRTKFNKYSRFNLIYSEFFK